MTKQCTVLSLVILPTEQRNLPFYGQRVKEEGGGGRTEMEKGEEGGKVMGKEEKKRGEGQGKGGGSRRGRRRKREGKGSLVIKSVGKALSKKECSILLLTKPVLLIFFLSHAMYNIKSIFH